MTDAVKFLADLSARERGNRLRLGVAAVRSVDSDPVYSISNGQSVIVPASQEWGEGGEIVANYLGEYPPRPGGLAWYVTDGVDRIVLGMVAPDGPPSVLVRQDNAVSLANNINGTVVFDTISHDPWNMTDASNTAIVIPANGLYTVAGYANFASNATATRRVFISVNGATAFASQWFSQLGAGTANANIQSVTAPAIRLSKGDLVSLRVFQNSGGALNVTDARLSAHYVGRARSTATTELLDDGGFESGLVNTTGALWSSLTTGGGAVSISTSARTGSYAMQLALASAGSAVTYSAQTWPVVPRAQYRVTAWSRTLSGTVGAVAAQHTRARLICSVDGTPIDDTGATAVPALASSYRSASTAWAQSTWDITIPDGVFVAQLELAHVRTATAGTVLFDDVSITEIIR